MKPLPELLKELREKLDLLGHTESSLDASPDEVLEMLANVTAFNSYFNRIPPKEDRWH